MNHATHALVQPSRPHVREYALRRGEHGLTLIELMVAVVVGSILVGFVFDIHSRMTSAFRSQNNIGSLQQGIRAANELIARDIRQAGNMMPDGAFVSDTFNPATNPVVQFVGGNNMVQGLTVFNNPDGRSDGQMQPDRVHVFYADPDPLFQTIVVGDVTAGSVGVMRSDVIQFGELALFVRRDPTPRPHPLGGNLPMVTSYFACVVEVTATLGGSTPSGYDEIQFDTSTGSDFNTATNDHCFVPGKEAIVSPGAPGVEGKTQMFRLIARAYQIDTTNELAAPLQVHNRGGLVGPWTTMGIGFVDLQITQRMVEEVADGLDPDNDLNFRMDWYSSGGPFPLNSHLTQVGIGLVARSVREVEGVQSVRIPVLSSVNPLLRSNNPLGDSGGPKSSASTEFNGAYVYRQSSMIVDMRNIGVAF